MSILGQFAAPVGAMLAQSTKMETIGMNIANLNTGGYKRTETNFSTMLAQTYDHNRDIGGVRAISRSMISQQGNIMSTASNYDLAINGRGFFLLNSEVDGSGTEYYGRDGMFEQKLGDEITTTVNGNSVTTHEGYLVDKNGYYLQGWSVNDDLETFPTDESTLGSIRIDPEAFTVEATPTSEASLGINIPGDAAPNYNESTFIKAYDSNGDFQTYQVRFTNYVLGTGSTSSTPTWDLPAGAAVAYSEDIDISLQNTQGFPQTVTTRLTKTAADTWELRVFENGTELDVDGTADGTANAVPVTFDPLTGAITAPAAPISVATQQDNGTTFDLDLSSLTQTGAGAAIVQTSITTDGVPSQGIDNNWTMEVLRSGNALEIDTDATPTRLQLVFDGSGKLTSPTSVSIPADGPGPAFSLDISDITNFASGQVYETYYDYNGNSDARLTNFSFNSKGEMIGSFSDATSRPIYKLPLTTFTNPDGLEPVNGNVYKLDPNAGEKVIRTAGADGAGTFSPNARELSNVDLADEFSKMIITQNAYNTASTVVKTVDEMTEVARDLKA